jgi:hypothetical protein
MTKYRLAKLFMRLSEKANLSKQYAQRTVFANVPDIPYICRRYTSKLASCGGSGVWATLCTVALGYCLHCYARSASLIKEHNHINYPALRAPLQYLKGIYYPTNH